MAQMQSCDELWDLLSAYADGMVTRDDASRIERHVAICPGCARDLRFMQETAHVLADAPEVAPPVFLRESILAATIYRPTWQQRLQAAARKLVPTSPLRAMAFAGGAAAILLVAYISSTRAPELSVGEPQGGVAAVSTPNLSNRALPSAPALTGKASVARNAAARTQIDPVKPNPADRATEPDESLDSAPAASSPRIVQAAHRSRLDPALRARAESALLARADSVIRGFGRKSSRSDVASGRPHVNESIPNLQPERPEQPREMLTTPSIGTADMKVPMTAMDTETPMPMRDMTGGSDAVTSPAVSQPMPRSHVTLASVTMRESAAPSSVMTLADLRRQLRHQNASSSESMHPELRLRARRDTLDVVKSTF